jgi:hypothetical protein
MERERNLAEKRAIKEIRGCLIFFAIAVLAALVVLLAHFL